MREDIEIQDLVQKNAQECRNWPKVAIIVLNWNGWRDTIECLESLQQLTYPDYQIIVVDNGSTDDSVEKIKTWARGEIPVESKFFKYDPGMKPVRWIEYDRATAEAGGIAEKEAQIAELPSNRRMIIIHNNENLGFAGGNNVAIKYALERQFNYIALLNNDTVVEYEWLTQLIDTLETNPKCIAISPKILHYAKPTKIWWAGGRLEQWTGRTYYIGNGEIDNPKWSGVRQVDAFSGCCFVARSSTFKRLGLLDEDMFFGGEEFAYGWDAKKQKLSICVNLDSKIYHKWGSSWRQTPRGEITPFIVYHARKNWLICVWKYGTPLQKLSIYSFYVLSRIYKFATYILQGKPSLLCAELRAIRDFLMGRYGDWDREQLRRRYE